MCSNDVKDRAAGRPRWWRPTAPRHAGAMRLTEHELTLAVDGAARSVFAARNRRRRGLDVDAAWEELDRYEKFQIKDAVGSQVLPVLVALPDVEVPPGTRPTFSTGQIQQVVDDLVGDDLGRIRRAVTIRARTALVQTALAHLPPRLDPDAPTPT